MTIFRYLNMLSRLELYQVAAKDGHATAIAGVPAMMVKAGLRL